MQYAPTHTDQKINSLLFIESSAGYVRGHMLLRPTLTGKKLDSLLSIESPARYVLGRMQYAPTLTDQKLDSLSSIESPARYVLGRMQYSPTLTDQKFDSPLKPPTRKDPFFGYLCRGVLHTPHKRPRQGTNESICHPFFEYT